MPTIKIADLMVGFGVDPKDWRRVNDRIKRLSDKPVLIKIGIDSDKAKKEADRFLRDVSKGIDTTRTKRTSAANQQQREIKAEENLWKNSRRQMQTIENAFAANNRRNLQFNAQIERSNMQNMARNIRFNAQLQRQAAAAQRAAQREETAAMNNMSRNLRFNLQLQRQVAAAQKQAAREALAALNEQTAKARALAAQVNNIALKWKNAAGSSNFAQATNTAKSSLAAMSTQLVRQNALVERQIASYRAMGTLTNTQRNHLNSLTRQANIYQQSLLRINTTLQAIAKSQRGPAGGASGSNMGMFLSGANAMGAFNSLGAYGGQLAVFSMGMSKASAAMAGFGLAAGATVLAMNDVTQAAADMEQELDGISSVSGLGDESMNRLKATFQQISRDLPVTTTQLNDIARNATLMGVQGVQNIENFTKSIAKLGVATRNNNKAFEDMGDMSEQIAIFLNETGTTVQNFGRDLDTVIRTLAAVDQVTPGTINSTLRLAKYMASGAVTLGLTQSNIIALSGALSGLGANAEAGGSAVIRVLMKMERAAGAPVEQFGQLADQIGMTREELNEMMGDNPVAIAQAFAKQMGITTEEFAKLVHENPTEAFLKLSTGLNKASKSGADMTKILDSLGLANVRDIRLVDQLTVGVDLLRRSVDAANNAATDTEALNRRVAAATSNYRDKVAKLNNSFTALKQNIGGPVVEALSSLIDTFVDVTKETNISINKVDEFAKWAPEDDGVTNWVKTLVNSFKILQDIIGSVTDKLGNMNEAGNKQWKQLMEGFTFVQKRQVILKALTDAGVIESASNPVEAVRQINDYNANTKKYEELYDILMKSNEQMRLQAEANPNSPFYKANGGVPGATQVLIPGLSDLTAALNMAGRTILNEFNVSGSAYKHDGFNNPNAVHHGIDYAAPRGTPITSPFTGKISYREDAKNGKIFDLVDEAGNKLIGIHLDQFNADIQAALAKGAKQVLVQKGDLIGTVGNTGKFAGKTPHLHLEGFLAGSRTQSDPRLIPYGLTGKTAINTPASTKVVPGKTTPPPAANVNAYTEKELKAGQQLYEKWRDAQAKNDIVAEAVAMKAINSFKRKHGAAWKAIVDSNKRSEAEAKKALADEKKAANDAGVSLAVFQKYRDAALKLAKQKEAADSSKDPLDINKFKNDYAAYAKAGDAAINVFESVNAAYQNTLKKDKDPKDEETERIQRQLDQQKDLTLAQYQSIQAAAEENSKRLDTLRKEGLRKAGDNLAQQYYIESTLGKKSQAAQLQVVAAKQAVDKRAAANARDAAMLTAKELFKNDPKGLAARNLLIKQQYEREIAVIEQQGANERLIINTDASANLKNIEKQLGNEKIALLKKQLEQGKALTKDYYNNVAALDQAYADRLEKERDAAIAKAGDNFDEQYQIEVAYADKVQEARLDAAQSRLVADKRANEEAKAEAVKRAKEDFKNDPKGLNNRLNQINKVFSQNNTLLYQNLFNEQLDISNDRIGRFAQLSSNAMQEYNNQIQDTISGLEEMSDEGLKFLAERARAERSGALLSAVYAEQAKRIDNRSAANTSTRNEIKQQNAGAAGRSVTSLQSELDQLLKVVGNSVDERFRVINDYAPRILKAEMSAAQATREAAEAAEITRYNDAVAAAKKLGSDLTLLKTQHDNTMQEISDTYDASRITAQNNYLNTMIELIAEGNQEQLNKQLEFLDEMSGAERAAVRASLNLQLAAYKAKGEQGVAAVQAIEDAIKSLDKADRDLSRTFLKGLSTSAASVEKNLKDGLKGLIPEGDPTSASDAGNRAVREAESFMQGVNDDIDTLKEDFLGLENPSEADKAAYNARLKLLEDYLTKAKGLSAKIRQDAEADYKQEIEKINKSITREGKQNDLTFDKDSGKIGERDYMTRKLSLDLDDSKAQYDEEMELYKDNNDRKLIAEREYLARNTAIHRQYILDVNEFDRQMAQERMEEARTDKEDELEFLREMALISEAEYYERRKQMRLDDAAAQLEFDLAAAGGDWDKQQAAYAKYNNSVRAANRQTSRERVQMMKTEADAVKEAASTIVGIIGDETLTKVYQAGTDLFDSAMQIGKDITMLMMNPADVKSWASLIMNVFKAVDSIVTIIEELDPAYKAWKEAQLELVEMQNKALSGIEKRSGQFFNSMFASPYAEKLQKDALAREKRVNANFWQKLGWSLFGGAPEVMADQAAETLSKLQTIFASLADSISNVMEESLYNAYLSGDWAALSENIDKELKTAVVRPIIKTMLEAAISTGAMGSDLQAITDAIASGNYDALPGLVDKAIQSGQTALEGLRPAIERLPGYGSGAEGGADPFSSDNQSWFGEGPESQFSAVPTVLLDGFRDVRVGGERILQAAEIMERMAMGGANQSVAGSINSGPQSKLTTPVSGLLALRKV